MKNHIKKSINFEKDLDADLFEMANYYQEVTGLPMAIWAGCKSNGLHVPRIKVQKSYIQKMDPTNLFSISVENNPKIVAGDQGEITNGDLQKVFEWVRLNMATLLRLWNMEYRDFNEFEKEIIKVK